MSVTDIPNKPPPSITSREQESSLSNEKGSVKGSRPCGVGDSAFCFLSIPKNGVLGFCNRDPGCWDSDPGWESIPGLRILRVFPNVSGWESLDWREVVPVCWEGVPCCWEGVPCCLESDPGWDSPGVPGCWEERPTLKFVYGVPGTRCSLDIFKGPSLELPKNDKIDLLRFQKHIISQKSRNTNMQSDTVINLVLWWNLSRNYLSLICCEQVVHF